jgi:hypothetical protein
MSALSLRKSLYSPGFHSLCFLANKPMEINSKHRYCLTPFVSSSKDSFSVINNNSAQCAPKKHTGSVAAQHEARAHVRACKRRRRHRAGGGEGGKSANNALHGLHCAPPPPPPPPPPLRQPPTLPPPTSSPRPARASAFAAAGARGGDGEDSVGRDAQRGIRSAAASSSDSPTPPPPLPRARRRRCARRANTAPAGSEPVGAGAASTGVGSAA